MRLQKWIRAAAESALVSSSDSARRAESGSPADAIAVCIHEQSEAFSVEVADRGSGLAENVLRDALLPFYSTKATGTGRVARAVLTARA